MADFGALFKSAQEQLATVDGIIQGKIPSWINGSLLRLGPGKFDLGEDFVMTHWFDGFGILLKFQIKNGQVTFIKKFVDSDAFKRGTAVGKPVFIEYGTRSYTDPMKSFFSRLRTALLPELTDSCAINIFKIQDSVYVGTETNFIRRIDPDNLETCEKVDLSRYVNINWASTHYTQDENGDNWNMATSFSTAGFQYHLVKIPAVESGRGCDAIAKASIVKTVGSSWKTNASYYHSFLSSENYVIFIEQPLLIIGTKVMTVQMKSKCLRECMEWQPNEMNKFIVIKKSTGETLSYNIKSTQQFFTLHHINAYEDNGHLVIDTLGHDSPAVIDKLELKKLRNSEISDVDCAYAQRYVFPILDSIDDLPNNENVNKIQTKSTAVKIENTLCISPEVIDIGTGIEIPSMNPKYKGKRYRYFYTTGMYDPGQYRNTLVKVDTETHTVKTWKQDEYTFPGEAQFIAKPNATKEDDGVLISAVTDVRPDQEDFLLFLDAETLTEIARAKFNVTIPSVLHNLFIPDL